MPVQKDGEVLPIEIKSGNTRASSLRAAIAKWPEIGNAYKFVDGNIGEMENGCVTMPLYMLMFV